MVRRGWYALPDANPDVVRAVASGAVLGCVSALVYYGVWDTGHPYLHVFRSKHGRRMPPGKIGWCRPVHVDRATGSAVVSPMLALRQAACCVEPDDLVVLLDSVINTRLLTRQEIDEALTGLASHVRTAISRMDLAESGTESLARLRIRRLGVKVKSQVRIGGVGRVDLLVGDRLVIEIDSIEHHTSQSAYHRDRRRDQILTSMGYVVLRLTYEQVLYHWDEMEALILSLARSGRHLARVAGPGRASQRLRVPKLPLDSRPIRFERANRSTAGRLDSDDGRQSRSRGG